MAISERTDDLRQLGIRALSRDVLSWLILKERMQEIATAPQSGAGISYTENELDGQFLGFLPSLQTAEFQVSDTDAHFRHEIIGRVITAQVAPDVDEAMGINGVLGRTARITVRTQWSPSSDPHHTITRAILLTEDARNAAKVLVDLMESGAIPKPRSAGCASSTGSTG